MSPGSGGSCPLQQSGADGPFRALALGLGVVAGLAFLTTGLLVGYRMYLRSEADPDTVRLPTLT